MILEPYMSRNKKLLLAGSALLVLVAGVVVLIAR
jgi:hypothetical protein